MYSAKAANGGSAAYESFADPHTPERLARKVREVLDRRRQRNLEHRDQLELRQFPAGKL